MAALAAVATFSTAVATSVDAAGSVPRDGSRGHAEHVLTPGSELTSTPFLKPANVASTETYIRAYYALVRTAKTKVPVQQAVAADLVRKVSSHCAGVLVGSPHNTDSAALDREALGAVSIAILSPDRQAITHFARAVKSLRWSSPKLTRLVKAYAEKLKAEGALTAPDLCRDMKTWATSGFRTVPGNVTRFNRASRAAAKGPQEIPSRLLAAYASPRGKATLHTIERLEGEIEVIELNTGVHALDQILTAVGLSD
jgi:hypothetical protein